MSTLREKTCCFVGHQNIPTGLDHMLVKKADEYITKLLKSGVIYFGVGGTLGFDTLMAQHLIALREAEPRIRIIEVLPYEGYRGGWTPEQKVVGKEIDAEVDKLVYCSQTPWPKAFSAASRRLVDGSGYCIAYCVRNIGETSNIVRYAQKSGIPVHNTAEYNLTGF